MSFHSTSQEALPVSPTGRGNRAVAVDAPARAPLGLLGLLLLIT